MPATLDSLIHKVVNTTSIPIRVEGGNGLEPQSGGTLQYKTFLWSNGFNLGCFQLRMSQNVATSMPSLTNQSCRDSLLAVCLAGQVGVIYRPPKHPWCQTGPWIRPQLKQTVVALAIVSLLLYLLSAHGGEKWNFKLCAYKTPLGFQDSFWLCVKWILILN